MRTLLASLAVVSSLVVVGTYVNDRVTFAACNPAVCLLDDFPLSVDAEANRTFEGEGVWEWCLPTGSTPTHGAAFDSGFSVEIEELEVDPEFFNPSDPDGNIPVVFSGLHEDNPSTPAVELEAFVWPPYCEDQVIVGVNPDV